MTEHDSSGAQTTNGTSTASSTAPAAPPNPPAQSTNAAPAPGSQAEGSMNGAARSGSATSSTSTTKAKREPGTGPPPPGRRAIQSCSECKRRKVRCDRQFPCQGCKMRGDEALCERPESTLAPALHDTLIGRMANLESVVRTLQRTVARLEGSTETPPPIGPSASSSPAAIMFEPTPPQQHSTQQRHQPQQQHQQSQHPNQHPQVQHHQNVDQRPQQQSRQQAQQPTGGQASPPDPKLDEPTPAQAEARAERGQPEEEEVALMLEDFAMGYGQNRERVSRQLNPEHAPATSDQQPRGPAPNHPFSLLDPQRSWSLVTIYLRRIEWYTKTLHGPSFLAECEHLLSLGPDEAMRQARPAFLCCYLLVLCVALHLIEPAEASALGFTHEQASDLSSTFFASATSLLWSSDWLRNPSLEFLQAVVLMGVYSYNVDNEADAHWSLLGSAIKVAQNLGLSRLGTESKTKQWPTAWKSFRKRETGRRVWWNLVTLDWSHAQAHNGTYCVHPSQNHTAPPSNVNDIDMNDEFVVRPLSEYTESSMSIYKLSFVSLYRTFIDEMNVRRLPDYSFIIDMDTRICSVIESFPPYFANVSGSSDDPRVSNLVKECLLIRITAANRHLRLHRPYLMRGYHDKAYAASKDRCVASARSVLTLLQIAGQRCPEIFKIWIVLFYGFVASIVAFIDLTRNPSDATRAALHDTVALFKHGEQTSAAARNAISLLQGLLAAEEEIAPSHGPAAKRRRLDSGADSTEDPFRKVVNRLLLHASQNQNENRYSPSGISAPSPANSISRVYTAHSPMPMPVGYAPQQQQPNMGAFFGGNDYNVPGTGIAELFAGDLDALDGNFGFMDLVQFDPNSFGGSMA